MDDPWLRFTLAALATWRLATLLAHDDGPWDAMLRLRRAAAPSAGAPSGNASRTRHSRRPRGDAARAAGRRASRPRTQPVG